MVKRTWLSEDFLWAKSGEGIEGPDMHMQTPNSYIAEVASNEAVSLEHGALHSIFATTSDDWMYKEGGDEVGYEPTDNEGEPQLSQEVLPPKGCSRSTGSASLSFRITCYVSTPSPETKTGRSSNRTRSKSDTLETQKRR